MDVAIRDATVLAAVGSQGRTFHILRQIGVPAVEIEIAPDFTTPHLREKTGELYHTRRAVDSIRLAARLADEGLRASALLLATDFSAPNAAEQVEWAADVITGELDVPSVRLDPLARDKLVARDRVRDNVIRAVEQILGRTVGSGVDLAIENHGPFANDPTFLDEIFAAVPDPRLGMTLDTGNFYWFGFPLEEVYGLIEKYAPRTKHTHIKNINFPADLANRRRDVGHGYKEFCCGVDEGNLDLRRVVKILRDAGYDRDMCVEDESLFKVPPDRRVEALRRQVWALREAVTSAARD